MMHWQNKMLKLKNLLMSNKGMHYSFDTNQVDDFFLKHKQIEG